MRQRWRKGDRTKRNREIRQGRGRDEDNGRRERETNMETERVRESEWATRVPEPGGNKTA